MLNPVPPCPQAEMLHANETIRRLEEKLSEMALAKEELEKGQAEYLEMVKQGRQRSVTAAGHIW